MACKIVVLVAGERLRSPTSAFFIIPLNRSPLPRQRPNAGPLAMPINEINFSVARSRTALAYSIAPNLDCSNSLSLDFLDLPVHTSCTRRLLTS